MDDLIKEGHLPDGVLRCSFWVLVAGLLPSLSSHFHPLSAPEGLTEMPNQWWIEIQRAIFSDHSQVSCQSFRVKQNNLIRLIFEFRLTFEPERRWRYNCFFISYSWLDPTKVLLSEERARVILTNYRLNGVAWYLASVAKKFMDLGNLTINNQ